MHFNITLFPWFNFLVLSYAIGAWTTWPGVCFTFSHFLKLLNIWISEVWRDIRSVAVTSSSLSYHIIFYLISERLVELLNASVWIFSSYLEPRMLEWKFILYFFYFQYSVMFLGKSNQLAFHCYWTCKWTTFISSKTFRIGIIALTR